VEALKTLYFEVRVTKSLHVKLLLSTVYLICTVCPTRYRTWHFYNNSNTDEDTVGVRSLCEKWKGMCLLQISLQYPH